MNYKNNYTGASQNNIISDKKTRKGSDGLETCQKQNRRLQSATVRKDYTAADLNQNKGNVK